jgi:hypothetical protein
LEKTLGVLQKRLLEGTISAADYRDAERSVEALRATVKALEGNPNTVTVPLKETSAAAPPLSSPATPRETPDRKEPAGESMKVAQATLLPNVSFRDTALREVIAFLNNSKKSESEKPGLNIVLAGGVDAARTVNLQLSNASALDVLRACAAQLDLDIQPVGAAIVLTAKQPVAVNQEDIGIGVVLKEDNGRFIIDRILPDSPASADGSLKPGHEIRSIGDSGDQLTAISGWKMGDVVRRLRGKEGMQVSLFVVREGLGTIVTLIRRHVPAMAEQHRKSTYQRPTSPSPQSNPAETAWQLRRHSDAHVALGIPPLWAPRGSASPHRRERSRIERFLGWRGSGPERVASRSRRSSLRDAHVG